MKKIKFLERSVFEQFGPNHEDNPVFEVDQVETMRNDQADRWLKRKRAELVEDLGADELVIEGVPANVIADVREQVEQRVEAENQAEADEEAKAVDALEQSTQQLADEVDDKPQEQRGRGRR